MGFEGQAKPATVASRLCSMGETIRNAGDGATKAEASRNCEYKPSQKMITIIIMIEVKSSPQSSGSIATERPKLKV